jgi:hypothetical protein
MEHIGPVIVRANNINIIRCECGIVHQDPLPSKQDIASYYNNDQFYATHSPTAWFIRNKQEHELGLWWPSYDYQAKLLSHHHYGLRKYPSVIDIGCGDAWWLMRYHRCYNQSSWGIEPSETARMLSPISGRIATDIDSLNYKRYTNYNLYNSVRMALVLEHVVDPVETIMTAKQKFIGTKGKLLVIVPNEFNPLQQKIQARINDAWYVQQPHINYFDKNSIKNLLQKCGFRITYQGGTFPMELLYLKGYHDIGNDAVGQRCHQIRLNFEKRMGASAFRLYHMLYQTLGWGRETLIVGEIVS